MSPLYAKEDTYEIKRFKKNVAAKRASLRRVLKKNEKIKKTVKKAASELTLVNEVLKQEKVPVQIMKQALTQNEDVEQRVKKAADDLKLVNVELAEEMAERIVIESELADTKTDLAEIRDDLSNARVKTEEAQQTALQDALTGLPNRVSFEQSLDHGLIQAKRHGWGLAVLFIDIDKFKRINDSYGHDAGDQVLLMVANRLKSFVRDQDIVSRRGGDEFVCLLLEVKQEADVNHLAQKMINHIAEAYEFNGHVFSIVASIGIAIYPADGETADILFKNADTAMYKANGTKKRVVLFRESGERKAG
ncbi:MAG: diguanylate cyclase [Smithella sp.]|nr:diguanylate cyclase [Smithella sp.]